MATQIAYLFNSCFEIDHIIRHVSNFVEEFAINNNTGSFGGGDSEDSILLELCAVR